MKFCLLILLKIRDECESFIIVDAVLCFGSTITFTTQSELPSCAPSCCKIMLQYVEKNQVKFRSG